MRRTDRQGDGSVCPAHAARSRYYTVRGASGHKSEWARALLACAMIMVPESPVHIEINKDLAVLDRVLGLREDAPLGFCRSRFAEWCFGDEGCMYVCMYGVGLVGEQVHAEDELSGLFSHHG